MKRYFKGFLISLGMFSVLPVPYFEWDDESMGMVMPFLPLVGGIVGGLWWGGAWLLAYWQLPLLLHGLALALLPVLLTGMLHLDGFMDTMDAVLSCRHKEERLRILKDPHMGAFGVAAFGILLLCYFCAGVSLVQRGFALPLLVLVPLLSRTVVASLMGTHRPLSHSGYAAGFSRQRGWGYHLLTLLELAVALGLGWLWGGVAAFVMLGVLLAAALLCWLLLQRQFGGISGDLCGCIITVSELAALVALAVY